MARVFVAAAHTLICGSLCRDGGRDISADLAEHWRRCCVHDFGEALQMAGSSPEQPEVGWPTGVHWRQLYERQQASEAEKRRSVGQRLRGMWAAEAEQRSSRSIEVPLPRMSGFVRF